MAKISANASRVEPPGRLVYGRAFAIPQGALKGSEKDFQGRQFGVLLMVRWRIELEHQNSPKRNATVGMADSGGKSSMGKPEIPSSWSKR
jgi:hypothetical protein